MPSFNDVAQAFVNSLDDGLGRRILRLLLFACLAGGILIGYAALRFRGLRDAEAMEYAQLGRNLAEGRGYVTRSIRPFDAAFSGRHGGEIPRAGGFPELRRPPVYPLLLASTFRLTHTTFETPDSNRLHPAETRAIVPLNLVVTLLTCALLFFLGRLLFSPVAGAAAAAVYLVCDQTLRESVAGTPLPTMALLSAAAVYAAVRCHQQHGYGSGRRRAALAALAAALSAGAILTGYAAVAAAIVPACIVAAAYPNARLRAAGLYAAVVVLCLAPWVWHNLRLCGAPFGTAPYTLLHDTFLFPADTLDRSLHAAVDNTLLPAALREKAAVRLAALARNPAAAFGGGLAGAFFLISFFVVYEKPEANALRWAMAGGVAATVAAVCLGPLGADGRTAALLPIAVLLAAGAFVAVTERLFIEDILKDALIWLFVGLTLLPAAVDVLAVPPPMPYPPTFPPFIGFAAGLLEEDETLCADIPWAVAWYGDRDTVLLPNSPAELETLHETWRPMAALYLTTETGDRRRVSELLEGRHAAWLPVLERRVPEGFPFRDGIALPPDGNDQLFLVDRIRWRVNPLQDLAEDMSDEFAVEPETRSEE